MSFKKFKGKTRAILKLYTFCTANHSFYCKKINSICIVKIKSKEKTRKLLEETGEFLLYFKVGENIKALSRKNKTRAEFNHI